MSSNFPRAGRDDSGRTAAVRDKNRTDRKLGELLTKQDVLVARAVEVWAPTRYASALEQYAVGDRRYLAKDYAGAPGGL